MSKNIFHTTMNFRVDKKDPQGRIFLSVFCGDNSSTRQKAGELVLTVGEYQAFMAALGLGARAIQEVQPDGRHVPLQCTVTGERIALERDDIPDVTHFPVPRPPWVK